MRSIILITSLGIAIALLSGCSESEKTRITTPQSPNQTAHASSFRDLWGLFEVTIDTADRTIEAVPMRTAMFRCNVNNIMEISGPKHLKFQNMDLSKYYSEGRLKLDVGLEHPFPGLDQYTGFDVWGVFMHNGSGLLTYDALTYPIGGFDGILENADGYTRWFNMPEFTGSGIIGYTPGKAGTPGFEPSALLNGYKVFADGLDAGDDLFAFLAGNANFADRLLFGPGTVNWRTYELRFPMVGGSPDLKFQYACHASWVLPSPNPPFDIPGDFPLDANVQEAAAISVSATETPWWNGPGDWGGDLVLQADVYDWQGALVDPLGIPAEISSLKVAGNIIPSTFEGGFSIIGGDDHYSTVQVEIPESMLSIASETGNECFVIIESANPSDYSDDGLIPPGNYPEGAALSSFARIPILLSEPPQPEIIDLLDITPPGWPAELVDVWVENNIAYCIGPYGGLVMFDVSGAGDPIYIGGLHLPGEGNELQVEGDHCYAADGSMGMAVIDVSDPSSPTLETTYVGTSAEGLHVLDGYIYLADGKGGLKILDIGGGTSGGSPSDPVLEGTYTVSYAAIDVFVVNGIAYVADLETAFLAIDVGGGTQGGSPSDPKLEGSLSSVANGDAITVNAGFAYVADNGTTHRIATIDVNTPSSPTLVNLQPVGTSVNDLWIDNGYLYAAADTSGLIIYKLALSDPPFPQFQVQFDTLGNSMGVYKSGDFAYVADYLRGLLKIDVSDPLSPSQVGEYFTPHDTQDLFVGDGYVYIADGSTGMAVMDIGGGGGGTAEVPLGVGYWDGTGEDCRGVWVEDGYAYLGGGWFNKHFYVVDVGASSGSPQNPVLIADLTYGTYQGVRGVMKLGSYVYATSWEDGLKVFDVDGGIYGGMPSDPKYVTTKPTNCSWELWAEGGYVYMADGDNFESRFYVYDVGGGGGNPADPTIIDSVVTPVHMYDVELVDSYAYVCGGDGLRVFDVSAPDDIQQVGWYNIAFPILTRGLCEAYGYVFLCGSDGGLYCVDIGGGQAGGSPTNPMLVDSITMPCDAFDAWVAGDYCYIVSQQGGLRVVKISQ